jgi:hypothetical protein
MQISANNLLIAGQQARAAQPAKPPAQAFEPLPLKKIAPDAPAVAAPQTGSPAQRPGSQLDIRV